MSTDDSSASRTYPATVDEYRRWWAEQRPDIPYGFCWCGCGQPTNLSRQRDTKLNYFAREPKRYIRGHAYTRPISRSDYKLENRGFDTLCWTWQRNIGPLGYGTLHERHTGKRLLAHRVYFERHRGPIPTGHQLHHLCNNRSCVNPEHLKPATLSEHRHIHGDTAKLTPQEVREIRELRGLSQGEIARRYGVSQSNIWYLLNGRTWRHV